MKSLNLIAPGMIAAVIILAEVDAVAQGSLNPTGAPGATIKTLEQLEPRTPISSLPYTIMRPGTYYLTATLSSTESGIVIKASGVTVDLMGFFLLGDGESGDYGIHVAGTTNAVLYNIVIKNGTISNFSTGLDFMDMNNSRIENLVVSGNKGYGIALSGDAGHCNGNTIADCAVSDNRDTGILLYTS